MASISFTIPGRIGGKGRGRAVRTSAGVRVVTPKQTRIQEEIVRFYAAKAMRGHPVFDDAVGIDVLITQHTPKSWSKKRKAAARYITTKPDASNQLKLLEDGMNRIVFVDDAQIAELTMARCYADDVPEAVTVTVEALPQVIE